MTQKRVRSRWTVADPERTYRPIRCGAVGFWFAPRRVFTGPVTGALQSGRAGLVWEQRSWGCPRGLQRSGQL
jgi:hypothetical protein